MPRPNFNKGSNLNLSSRVRPNREFDSQITLHTLQHPSISPDFSASMGIHHNGLVSPQHHLGGVLHQIRSSASIVLLPNASNHVSEGGSVQTVTKESSRTSSYGKGNQGFYLRYYFTVLKRDGGLRPILDLRGLNKFVTYKKFRMVILQGILPLLKEED